MSAAPVIWLAGGPSARARAAGVAKGLEPAAQPLFIGPAGEPAPDLTRAFGRPGPGAGGLPAGAQARGPTLPGARRGPRPGGPALPHPGLGPGHARLRRGGPGRGRRGGGGVAGRRPEGPRLALAAQVQVNLPLTMLLGRYRPLVEILAVNPEVGIDATALDRMGEGEVAQAAALLQGRRVTVHLPFMDLAPGSTDPAIAAASLGRLASAAEWALKLGAVRAVGHLGYLADTHRDLPAFCARLAEGLAPIATPPAREGGCELVLENTFEPAPEVLLAARAAIIDAGGPEVSFCLDVGHAHCFTPTPLAVWWEALSPHLGEMHLHDNDASFDYHMPPGCGGGGLGLSPAAHRGPGRAAHSDPGAPRRAGPVGLAQGAGAGVGHAAPGLTSDWFPGPAQCPEHIFSRALSGKRFFKGKKPGGKLPPPTRLRRPAVNRTALASARQRADLTLRPASSLSRLLCSGDYQDATLASARAGNRLPADRA